ncbi:MAG TPA: hypothetical protein VIN61_13885 [Gammaproteobacteria bacterium]
MATVAHEGRPQHERRYHERRRGWPSPFTRAEGMRVSWGGIFGGVLVALGLLMLLSALGLAIGISAVEPGRTDPSSVGTGAGIWGAVSMLVALFVGGWTATRIGAITDRTTGFFEGALVWVVSVLLMAYFATSGIGALAGGAFRVAGGATQAIGQAVQSQGGVDIDTSGSIEQIAQRLRDPQTAQRLAQVTGLPQDQVQQTLNQTAQRVQGSSNPAQAAQEAQRGAAQLMEQARSSGALAQRAEEIQPEASAAAWLTFLALLLSLAAAVIGSMVGRRRPEALQQAQPAT